MTIIRYPLRHTLALASLAVAAGLTLAPQAARAITSTWILQDANGTWNNPDNWDNGVPKEPGDIALITNNIAPSVSRTITIDTAVSLKALKFAVPTTSVTPAFTVKPGTGGSLTMNSGDGSHSAILQLRGSTRCRIEGNMVLSNDVDIINTVAAPYFDVACAISGNHHVHINPGMGANAAIPYMNAVNTFVGNMSIYYGQLMIYGGDACFGSLTNGIRQIIFYNNAAFRNNGSLSILGTNRQFVAGSGGGNYILHSRNLSLPTPDQLAGSEIFTLSTDSGTSANNIFTIGAANDGFTGTMLLSANVAFKLGADGSLSNSPLINLSSATSLFDVTGKSSGYSIPSNQVLAGIGVITGSVNVANASATIHPGSFALAGPTRNPGILTVTDGLSFGDGGTYAWELAYLKDNAFPPSTTTYSTLNVTGGDVDLSGGTLTVGFLNGIATPDTANAFWQTGHVWAVLTAASPPTGTLTVTDGIYGNWAFTTRVTGNALELVYGPYTSPPEGTLISVQ